MAKASTAFAKDVALVDVVGPSPATSDAEAAHGASDKPVLKGPPPLKYYQLYR